MIIVSVKIPEQTNWIVSCFSEILESKKESSVPRKKKVNTEINTEFVQANGLNFEVQKCGNQSSRKLAICLHGFPEHAISWRYQLPILAELGYKAWAPNMRGYGNSSSPSKREDYAIENLLEDVAHLIDAADVDETVLLAHDWGAVVGWLFAIRKVRPLEKLIICNVPHPAAASKNIGWRQYLKSWYIFFFQIPRLPEWMFGRERSHGMIKRTSTFPENYSEEVMETYSKNMIRPGGMKAMIDYYRDYFRGGLKRQRDIGFPIIEAPTLMCWGENDMALTKETTYGTERWVRNLTIRYLPRISHWVQQDAPREVNAMISAFLLDEDVPKMIWESKLVLEKEI